MPLYELFVSIKLVKFIIHHTLGAGLYSSFMCIHILRMYNYEHTHLLYILGLCHSLYTSNMFQNPYKFKEIISGGVGLAQRNIKDLCDICTVMALLIYNPT